MRVVVVGGPGRLGGRCAVSWCGTGTPWSCSAGSPARGSALGYEFGFPNLDAALRDLLGQADRPIAVAR